MNRELEVLVRARDALLLARAGTEADQRLEEYNALLDEILQRHPGLTRESLRRAVERAHARWIAAQKLFPPFRLRLEPNQLACSV